MAAISHPAGSAPLASSTSRSAPAERGVVPAALQRRARILGLAWLATFVTSITAVLLYRPLLHDHAYLTGSGHDTQIAIGALLEVLLIVANIATAVIPYSILRRQSEGFALGFVAARIMECMFIAVGVLALMTVVTLHHDVGGPGTHAASLDTVGRALVGIRNWTFDLGPGFVVGIGNGLIFGWLMYRSGLLPRALTWLGLVGGPLIVLTGAAVLLRIIDRGGVVQGAATAPEFLWELSIGLYFAIKGFRAAPLVTEAAEA